MKASDGSSPWKKRVWGAGFLLSMLPVSVKISSTIGRFFPSERGRKVLECGSSIEYASRKCQNFINHWKVLSIWKRQEGRKVPGRTKMLDKKAFWKHYTSLKARGRHKLDKAVGEEAWNYNGRFLAKEKLNLGEQSCIWGQYSFKINLCVIY